MKTNKNKLFSNEDKLSLFEEEQIIKESVYRWAADVDKTLKSIEEIEKKIEKDGLTEGLENIQKELMDKLSVLVARAKIEDQACESLQNKIEREKEKIKGKKEKGAKESFLDALSGVVD